MLSKHQKYFFLVSSFWWLICKTYFIFKICGKTYLKINWPVKTSLYRHKAATCSALGAPVKDDEINTAKVVVFCVCLIWSCSNEDVYNNQQGFLANENLSIILCRYLRSFLSCLFVCLLVCLFTR